VGKGTLAQASPLFKPSWIVLLQISRVPPVDEVQGSASGHRRASLALVRRPQCSGNVLV